MPVKITNPYGAAVPLPSPLLGSLAPGSSILVAGTVAELVGTTPQELLGGLKLEDVGASAVLTPERLSRTTNGALTIHVSPTGSDSAAGTQGAPVATLAEAVSRIPDQVRDPVVIRLAAGTYDADVRIEGKMLNAPVIIMGDAFTELATGTAQSGTDGQTLVTSGGLTLDEFMGKTLEFTSGAAAGWRRTIRDNTTTDIIPCIAYQTAPAPGDTYRVVEPAVTLNIPDTPLVPSGADDLIGSQFGVLNCGNQMGAFRREGIPGPYGAGLVYLVNVTLTTADPLALAFLMVNNSSMALFGVEISDASFILFGFGDNGTVLSGMDLR